MDNSWSMLIGPSDGCKHKPSLLPRRRSTEDRSASSSGFLLGPEDFLDVFGGPPMTVLSRQFSATSSTPSYEEFFRPTMSHELLYSDIFTNSNSCSSENLLSPLRRGANGDSRSDVSFSGSASKLRPINTPNRWSSSVTSNEEQRWQEGPEFSTDYLSNLDSLFEEINFVDNFKSYHHRFSQRCLSPESNNREPTLHKVSVDDQKNNSRSSIIDQKPHSGSQHLEHGDDHEVTCSYVIENGRKNREEKVEEEKGEGVDEAIAWARKKFYSQKIWSNHEENKNKEKRDRKIAEDGTTRFPMEKEQIELNPKYEQPEINMRMELLDNNITKWASDKEANIRLLLSTLHQIIWPNSGWTLVPMKNLVDKSQVRKAYKKARLYLHPDKLQQRGATFVQNYIAAKVFSILQEAWDAYISQDVLFMS